MVVGTRYCQGFARQHLDSDEGTKKTRSPQTRQSKAIKSTPARASRGNRKVEVEPELEVEESELKCGAT